MTDTFVHPVQHDLDNLVSLTLVEEFVFEAGLEAEGLVGAGGSLMQEVGAGGVGETTGAAVHGEEGEHQFV